jgi:hypothetical protein
VVKSGRGLTYDRLLRHFELVFGAGSEGSQSGQGGLVKHCGSKSRVLVDKILLGESGGLRGSKSQILVQLSFVGVHLVLADVFAVNVKDGMRIGSMTMILLDGGVVFVVILDIGAVHGWGGMIGVEGGVVDVFQGDGLGYHLAAGVR